MFDWFWEFLYGITAAMCKLIDGVMTCANKLCGIDAITVDGEETDFLTFLFQSDEIKLAFMVAAIIGLVLVVFFSIYAILRNVAKGKVDESPTRICMKALKAILTFMLVPACMLTLMWCLNIIIQVMYAATLNGSTAGIGAYLVGAFSKEGTQLPDGIDYTDVDLMWNYFNLKKYQFFFSWITCFIILIQTAKALIMFVDRAISIVILYVVSPFSISASVLDDGAHFKLWRDQILVKFLNGYGTIIALNIYAMVCALVSRPDVVFFSNSFINFLMKVLIIVGGAFSLQRIMGLIGNLVSAGAGNQEMQQVAMANAGMKGLIGNMFGAAKGSAMSLKKGITDQRSKQKQDKQNAIKANQEAEYKNSITGFIGGMSEKFGLKAGGGNTAKTAIEGKKDEKPAPTPTDDGNSDKKDNALTEAINGTTGKDNTKNPVAGAIGGGTTLGSGNLGAAPTAAEKDK